MEFEAPTPFDEALRAVLEKGLLPTSLDSKALRELQGELKRRAVFSARVTQAEILDEIKSQVADLASGATKGASYTRAKSQLLAAIKRTGYAPNEDEKGGITDPTSDRRLSLIIETNVRDSQGHGTFVAGNDPVALDINPGQELVRVGNPEKPRDWSARWEAALAATTRDGATSGPRFVALKNHPVWQALGDGAGGYDDTLGNPWPPFAFLSSMAVIVVSREDCVELGILDEETRVPSAEEIGLNDSLGADAARFSPELLKALEGNPELHVVDGVLGLR